MNLKVLQTVLLQKDAYKYDELNHVLKKKTEVMR